MQHIKLKLILMSLLAPSLLMAQNRLQKISQTINTTDDVTIHLNTSHTNIEVDTWNKDKIEIEAYIEGEKLSKEALEKELKNWNITVGGSGNEVTISSKGSHTTWAHDFDFDFDVEAIHDLERELAELPEPPEPPEAPELPEMPEMPEMPDFPELPELPDGIGNVNFDYDAYKKDGEKYLERWSKEYEEKYGKAYKEEMKAWAREFGKVDFKEYSDRMEKWGEEFGEKFGKEYEKKMEEWGKRFDKEWAKDFEKRMEIWAERHGKEMEQRAKLLEERLEHSQHRLEERTAAMKERAAAMAERHAKAPADHGKMNTKVKKVIKIKMPKKAKLKMDVRHGELTFATVIHDLKGNISHSALTANSIDGSKTSINVSYSPVWVTNWIMGELKLNFVQNAQIENVNRLVLNSKSSNIAVNNLMGNAVINGSFGELAINNIMDSFGNLNLMLENSEVLIVMPKVDFNLQYNGNRSKLNHPKRKPSDTSSTFSTGNMNNSKTIVINAKFSEVVMQ